MVPYFGGPYDKDPTISGVIGVLLTQCAELDLEKEILPQKAFRV